MTERRANPYGYTEARKGRFVDAAMVIVGIGMALSAVVGSFYLWIWFINFVASCK